MAVDCEISPCLESPEVGLSQSGQSRRAVLSLLTAGATFASAGLASAQAEGELSESQLQKRLLRRITYGPTESEVRDIKEIGYDAYLESQLNYEAIDDSACEAAAAWYSTINFDVHTLFKVRVDVAKHELSYATVLRALKSKRQLYQRMVEFWTDHFNVYFDKVGVLKVVHDREVIRQHALGNFRQMLMANTKSPATLVYLDNEPSTKEAPNQNLARELMELHTLGVNGGYTQRDVIEVAKCLTGWTTILWPEDDKNVGKFVFNKTMHHNGDKVVLGKSIPSGGWITDGETVVRMLGARLNTGKNLARKLCRFFLGYEPSQALVDEIASAFVQSQGDIKTMLRIVLRKDNVAAAPLMMKRPFHYTMGMLRQAKAKVDNTWLIREILYEMGQHPFEWAPPNGYPHASAYWTANLLPRWNLPFRLFYRDLDLISVKRDSIFGPAATVEEVLARINAAFFQGEMTSKAKAAIRLQLIDDASALNRAMQAAAMACTLPGYQKC
jgi:uncharacterized protein (DUF1800 family)